MELYHYADNWQLKGDNVNATSEAFKALKDFTDISRLHWLMRNVGFGPLPLRQGRRCKRSQTSTTKEKLKSRHARETGGSGYLTTKTKTIRCCKSERRSPRHNSTASEEWHAASRSRYTLRQHLPCRGSCSVANQPRHLIPGSPIGGRRLPEPLSHTCKADSHWTWRTCSFPRVPTSTSSWRSQAGPSGL